MTTATGLPRPTPLPDRSDAPPRERTDWMLALMRELFPVPDNAGEAGDRRCAARARLRLRSGEVASGTQVLDWTIPNEWSIRRAHVSDSTGRRVVDLATEPHVVSYGAGRRDDESRRAAAAPALAARASRLDSVPHQLLLPTTGVSACRIDSARSHRAALPRRHRRRAAPRRFAQLRRGVPPSAIRPKRSWCSPIAPPVMANDNLLGNRGRGRGSASSTDHAGLGYRFVSRRPRSARSPRWPPTRLSCRASAAASCSPTWATRARCAKALAQPEPDRRRRRACWRTAARRTS